MGSPERESPRLDPMGGEMDVGSGPGTRVAPINGMFITRSASTLIYFSLCGTHRHSRMIGVAAAMDE
ncbi:hypothetical protein [Burkholderia oklahomensis]|uniref:hypothetical protein n=1 Tax=Burkholderia oklahomensis TaxID=342113 RepID=UPI000AA91B7B|nr:hypothetical protein [Burkholderia oklahomensis]